MVDAISVNKNTPGALKCKRPGCGRHYLESDNDGTKCRFHSGQPVFHDLKKGWACCNQIVYEWDEFQKIVGCCMGRHSNDDDDGQSTFWQSSTVANASTAVRKAEVAALKTAADFNRE